MLWMESPKENYGKLILMVGQASTSFVICNSQNIALLVGSFPIDFTSTL